MRLRSYARRLALMHAPMAHALEGKPEALLHLRKVWRSERALRIADECDRRAAK